MKSYKYSFFKDKIECENNDDKFSLKTSKMVAKDLALYESFMALCDTLIEEKLGEKHSILVANIVLASQMSEGRLKDRITFQLPTSDLKSICYVDLNKLTPEQLQIVQLSQLLFEATEYSSTYTVTSDQITKKETGQVVEQSSVDVLVAVDELMDADTIEMTIDVCNPKKPSEFLLVKGDERRMYKFHEMNETITNAFKTYFNNVNIKSQNFIPKLYE